LSDPDHPELEGLDPDPSPQSDFDLNKITKSLQFFFRKVGAVSEFLTNSFGSTTLFASASKNFDVS
jgi:hypothetical protein